MKKFETLCEQTINKNNGFLCESSWSRILQHIENDKSFAVISAYVDDLSIKENKKNHENLRKNIRKFNYGYIEMHAGYTYTNDNKKEILSNEESFFIPNIPYKEAMTLADDYKQESILFNSKEKGFIVVYVRDGQGFKKDDIYKKFKTAVGGRNITFNPDILKDAFSLLKKATRFQRKQKFAYVKEDIHYNDVKLSYLHEVQVPSWGCAMGNAVNKKQSSTTILKLL